VLAKHAGQILEMQAFLKGKLQAMTVVKIK